MFIACSLFSDTDKDWIVKVEEYARPGMCDVPEVNMGSTVNSGSEVHSPTLMPGEPGPPRYWGDMFRV